MKYKFLLTDDLFLPNENNNTPAKIMAEKAMRNTKVIAPPMRSADGSIE